MAVIFLFHLPQYDYLYKTYTIFSKVYEGTSFRDPNVRGASVTSATQVRASSPLLLLTMNYETVALGCSRVASSLCKVLEKSVGCLKS